MTDAGIDVKAPAKATLHLKVMRANGTVEEFDVPVETGITREQVLAMIAQHNSEATGLCGAPASAAIQTSRGWVAVCEEHLQEARDRMPAMTARAASGVCAARGS